MQDNMELSVAHLYPQLLNLFGDGGNITALRKRCEWRGIKFNLEEINKGGQIDTSKYDLYFLGGGQEVQQLEVAQELENYKENLQQAATDGKTFLGIFSGYQLFGEYFETQNGEQIKGLNILDVYTKKSDKRFTGNVTANVDFLTPKTIVGFENHAGLTYLKNDTKPLMKIEIGKGNNGEDASEGARKNNVFGTYLHGAILPQNPHFADYLIKTALSVKYGEEITLQPINSDLEFKAHKELINKKY